MAAPTLYSEKFADIAYEQALLGKTNEEIAKAMCISPNTLYEWRKAHEEFRVALQAGKDIYDSENVENAMKEDALGHEWDEVTLEADKEGNMVETKRTKKWQRNFQAQRMWLLNRSRERWKDQTEVVITSKELEAKLMAAERRLKEIRDAKASESRDPGRT